MKNKFIFNIYSVNREGFLKIFIKNNYKKKQNIEFQIKKLIFLFPRHVVHPKLFLR